MIFPFKITRKFKLPDSEFGTYSSEEIIDFIYDYLTKEEFKSLKKQNNEIELIGDRRRWKNYTFNWSKTDRVTHCIDHGIIRIQKLPNGRKLFYTFQIKSILLELFLESIIVLLLLTLVSWSLQTGLFFLQFLLGFILIIWIYLLITHPTSISAPIEILRYQAIRKNLEKK